MRVKLDTVAAAGFTRGASVSAVMEHVRHVGGDLYDLDFAAVMSLPEAQEPPAADLSEYATLIAEAAAALPRATLPARPGLGDMVASGLKAVGITKERVSALVGGPCGCPERQAALNQIGHKYLGLPTGTRG